MKFTREEIKDYLDWFIIVMSVVVSVPTVIFLVISAANLGHRIFSGGCGC